MNTSENHKKTATAAQRTGMPWCSGEVWPDCWRRFQKQLGK
jgi:hypothetical protein